MKRLSPFLLACGLLVNNAPGVFGAAGTLSFANPDTILLTEDPALTPTASVSLARTDGTDGVVTAELAAIPLAGLESTFSSEYPPLRYRHSPADAWAVLPWRGVIPVTLEDGVSEFTLEIQAIDNDAWEGQPAILNLAVPCSLKLQNVSAPAIAGSVTSKPVRIESNDPPPVMTVIPLRALEGNAQGSGVTRYVRVELDRAIARRSIRYTPSLAAGGTAAHGTDFTIPEELTGGGLLRAYVREFTVPVTFFPDTVLESDETFTLGVSLTALPLGPGSDSLTLTAQTVITIRDDDHPPVTIAAASVEEGHAGTAELVFPVSLSAALSNDVSFQWSTLSSAEAGRATAVEDFVAASGTVIIPAGKTAANISVTVNGDTTAEPDEEVRLGLTNPSGVSLPEADPAGLILGDELAHIRLGSPRVAEGAPGTLSKMSFPVTLTIAQEGPVSFDYTTAGGTGAEAGIDFVATTGTVILPPGETSTVIDVQVRGDSAVETDEAISLLLSNGSGALLPAWPQTGWILNDDLPSLLPPFVRWLGETDADYLHVVSFSLSDPSLPNTHASVNWSLDAPTGSITPTSGTLNFSLGQSALEFTVPGDDVPEANQVISITFSDPVNLAIPANGATFELLRLGDDDRPVVTGTGGSIIEGSAGTVLLPFAVSMSAALPVDLTFNYSTENGSATAGQDYEAALGAATIPAGATSTVISVRVSSDADIELDETIHLTLSEFSVPSDAGSVAPGVILTDDFPPGPAPQATLVTEASGDDTTRAWFAIDLSAPRTLPFSCRVSTRDATALAGSDYRALAPTDITFEPGETRKWVAITVTAVPEPETAEQFHLDVEALDSHEVKSAACTIARLAITDFWRPFPGIFAIRFPTGLGQRYIIEEAASPAAGWVPASPILTGTGFPVTQLMFSESDSGFFHVRSAPPLPPGTPAAGS